MIRKITDINECLDYLESFYSGSCFSMPFCDRERVRRLAEGNTLLACYDNEKIIGVFCLGIWDEKTIETLFMYSKEEKAYEELIQYIQDNYLGYEMWFVLNPNNNVLRNKLVEMKAYFYPEQIFMEYEGKLVESDSDIVEYDDRYKEEYIALHSVDGYWTGEKVLENIDDFKIFVCHRDNHVVGYVDLGIGEYTNEIMDIRVSDKYQNKKIGFELLNKAIEAGGNKRLVLTVDVDNVVAKHLYEKIGFVEMEANNSLTAKLDV